MDSKQKKEGIIFCCALSWVLPSFDFFRLRIREAAPRSGEDVGILHPGLYGGGGLPPRRQFLLPRVLEAVGYSITEHSRVRRVVSAQRGIRGGSLGFTLFSLFRLRKIQSL